MKLRCFFILILIPMLSFSAMDTAIFISVGHLNYSFRTYSRTSTRWLPGDSSDLFIGVSLNKKNYWEFNMIFNRCSGELEYLDRKLKFSKIGFGLEAGKIVSIHVFKKNEISVDCDFVGGLYGELFPIKDLRFVQDNEKWAYETSSLLFQFGWYWTIRFKATLLKSASFDFGFKTMNAFEGNDFYTEENEKTVHSRTFFFVGITF